MSKRFVCPNVSEFKNKLEEKSDLIKELNIPSKEIKDYNVEMFPNMYNAFCSEDKINQIIETIEYLHSEKEADTKKIVKELLSNKTFEGQYLELQTYKWLRDCNVEFVYQMEAKTISSSKVKLDGRFDAKRIHFDIKAFGLGETIAKELKRKLEEEFPEYIFLIEGRLDQDYKVLEKKVLSKIYEHIRNIDTSKKQSVYKIKETEWTIRWHERKPGVYIGQSSYDPYEWAQNNEKFFLKNVTQYTPETPFILICTMPETRLPFNEEIGLRSLARRAFCHLHKIEVSKYTIGYDKIQQKYQNHITGYLSGIFFLDLKCQKAYMYLNPNAINKVSIIDLNRIFGFNIPAIGVIDTFEYDNY